MNNQTFEKEKATSLKNKKQKRDHFVPWQKHSNVFKREKKKQARASCCIDLSPGLRVLQPRECCVMFFWMDPLDECKDPSHYSTCNKNTTSHLTENKKNK